MIKYSLVCESDHGFEAWYKNGDDFETQKKRGFLECPVCGSKQIGKALMAPNVATSRKQAEVAVATDHPKQREIIEKMLGLARALRSSSEDVGTRFAEEARKIHYGESDARGIYGKASGEEVSGLIEEGIGILPLPDLPEDMN